jgi:hypothetical protein
MNLRLLRRQISYGLLDVGDVVGLVFKALCAAMFLGLAVCWPLLVGSKILNWLRTSEWPDLPLGSMYLGDADTGRKGLDKILDWWLSIDLVTWTFLMSLVAALLCLGLWFNIKDQLREWRERGLNVKDARRHVDMGL